MAALCLFGCDASQTDPTFARIESVTIQNAPDESNGGGLYAHLYTVGFDTVRLAETEAVSGPLPLQLELPFELPVLTADGPFEGTSLFVKLYQLCEGAGCTDTSTLLTAAIQPYGWPGMQRTVQLGGAHVTLTYRRTTS